MFDAVVPFWRKMRRVDKIEASSCVEETCGSSLGCSVCPISATELVYMLGTYGNVRHNRLK